MCLTYHWKSKGAKNKFVTNHYAEKFITKFLFPNIKNIHQEILEFNRANHKEQK